MRSRSWIDAQRVMGSHLYMVLVAVSMKMKLGWAYGSSRYRTLPRPMGQPGLLQSTFTMQALY
jgi:hypothetical protein